MFKAKHYFKYRIKILLTKIKRIPRNLINFTIKLYHSSTAWASVFSILVLFGTLLALNIINSLPKKEGPVILSVTSNAEVENITNPSQPDTAESFDIVKWQKNIDFANPDTESRTEIIESIPDNQEYQSGSLDLPLGWVASYSTLANPTENDFAESEPVPASAVKTIKLSYKTVTTHKPVSQTALTKPLDQEEITAPPGMTNPRTLTTQEFNDKLFIIYKAVDVSDGVNDTQDLTLNCLDLRTYQICDGSEFGVTFPTYMSSSAGTKFGSLPKDISTPKVARLAFDDGVYGHEGYLYLPAQQGNNYGVNCINLRLMENCGFIIVGSSTAPSQPNGENPTLISGFAQYGNRLYGHANPNDAGAYNTRHLKVFCFDMQTVGFCSDYASPLTTQIPALDMAEHGNNFFTTGQNVIVGDKYFFMMNYDEANPRANTLGVSTQTYFGNRVVCFDLVTKLPCASWTSGNVEYRSPEFGCGSICYFNDMVYGRILTEKVWGALGDYDYPRSLFVWKGSDSSDKALCVVTGSHEVTIDPGLNCLSFSNGQNYTDGVNGSPPGMLPTQWLSVPWEPGTAIATTSESGNSKFYHSYSLPSGNLLLPGNTKSAVLCYDWTIQAPCSGFRFPHYWYEIRGSDALDASYVSDGKCMVGVSGYDFAWSFDANTGESPCRHIQKTMTISPQNDLNNAYCDGKSRSPGWSKLKLDKSSLYDYRYFKVTVKDKNGNIVGSFNKVDLKTEPGGHLDISSIALSGNTDRLIVDIEAEIANTSPWGDDPSTVAVDVNVPYLTAEMSGDPAQYCYETRVPDLTSYCDIDSVSTTTEISAELEFDTLEANNQSNMPVTIDAQTQCKKDLKISVSADKTTAKPGDLVSYTVQVENQANISPLQRGNIPGADVEATIPAGTTLYNSGGGSVVGGKVVWSGESFTEKQSKSKTVTVQVNSPTAQISPVTSFASVFGVKAYAQSSQTIPFSAQVVYANDVNQADNSVAFNDVAVVPETPTEETPTEETPAEETPTEETPTQNQEEEQNNNQGGFTGTGQESTPPASQQSPSITQRIANTVEESVKTIVQPIPEAIAKPLPYLFIAILIILALIFAYEAYKEVSLRSRLDKVNEKYHHTEELRSSYLQLISHYLNTPLTIMKSTLELIQGEHKVSEKTTNKIKEVLDNLTIHVSGLIDETKLIMDSNQSNSAISASIKNKRFMTWVIVPISATFALVLLLNAMFIVGDKYDPTAFNFVFQLTFYGLSAVALVFAYTSYKRQKFATIAATNELNYEETLIKSQQVFIHNASATLENDALELKYASEPIMGDPKGAVFSKGLGSINETAARLNYINEVTNFAGTKILEESTIREISDDIIKSYQKAFEDKKISLTTKIDKGIQAKVDEQGFKQLLNSTLNNAIKFGKEGGKVDLSIKKTASGMKIIVADDGIGIPKDKLDGLFTPFGRGTDVLNYDYEGIGLDLYTNKLIAEHNGGSIDVQSKEGNGTKVMITLPSKL